MEDDVHVWRVELDAGAEGIAALEGFLSPDEQGRADRFRSSDDRRRFIAARGSLRAILGHYLHREAGLIRFSYTDHGKPALAGPEPIRFNVSHSDDVALIAISWGRQVGADIERLRTDFVPEHLARRLFAPREYAALCREAPDARHAAFWTYWTCKEAYVKALGMGLHHPLRDFAVSLERNAFLLVGPADDGEEVSPLRLARFDPGPGFAAALAVEGGECDVKLFHFQDLRDPAIKRTADFSIMDNTGTELREILSMGNPVADRVTEQIREIVREYGRLSVDAAGLGEDSSLYDAGMTSHASVNVMLALENAFDVEFPDRMLRRSVFESVAAIRSALEELGIAE